MNGNKVTIEVRVSWMTTLGREYRNLVFNETQVDTVVGTNGAFILTFSGFSQLEMASGISVEGVVISETGVSAASKAIVVNETEDTWIVPCNYTAMTSPFGNRETGVAGETKFHNGVDLAAPEGIPVYASRSGVVTQAAYNTTNGYYVSIRHGDGFNSFYLHMLRYTVSVGQWVSQGDIIGYVGRTGLTTGSHLHYGITKDGEYVNPAAYLALY